MKESVSHFLTQVLGLKAILRPEVSETAPGLHKVRVGVENKLSSGEEETLGKMMSAIGLDSDRWEMFIAPSELELRKGPAIYFRRERKWLVSEFPFLELPPIHEILRNPDIKRQVWEDLKAYKKQLGIE